MHWRRYDFILTNSGSQPVIDGYKALGAPEFIPIYRAVDPVSHYHATADGRFAGTLGFLGNRRPDHETRVEEFFLGAAHLLPREDFVLGGSGWEEATLPLNIRRVGRVYSRDHNAFNCSPRAVRNINRSSVAQSGFSPPPRIFEAAGAGAFSSRARKSLSHTTAEKWQSLPNPSLRNVPNKSATRPDVTFCQAHLQPSCGAV